MIIFNLTGMAVVSPRLSRLVSQGEVALLSYCIVKYYRGRCMWAAALSPCNDELLVLHFHAAARSHVADIPLLITISPFCTFNNKLLPDIAEQFHKF